MNNFLYLQVESLEGSEPMAIFLKGKVSLPRLRLSTHRLELPPLFVLQPRVIQQQLKLYNDSDIPVKIQWKIGAADKREGQQRPLAQQQTREEKDAAVLEVEPWAEGRHGLQLSLSPSECIVEGRSCVCVKITCLGLCASSNLEAKAFCYGEGLVLPLQVSFAAACSGVSVAYALFTQQQLESAAELLRRKRDQRQYGWLRGQKMRLMSPGKREMLEASHAESSARTTKIGLCFNNSPSSNSKSGSVGRSRSSSREKSASGKDRDDNMESKQALDECSLEETANLCEDLQKAGIGVWGILQQRTQTLDQNLHNHKQEKLTVSELHAGSESKFLYVLVVNRCPIPSQVTLRAFTHDNQQIMPQKTLRHPMLCEEGRPAGALMCADCNSDSDSVNSSGKTMPACLMPRFKNVTRCTTNCSTNSNSGSRELSSVLTAEALLLQAASAHAPSETRQLQRNAFTRERPSFRAVSGVRTLQAKAGRERRQRLLAETEDRLVLIPHPESSCTLQQHQAALLALEMFAALPADFSAVLELSLEPCLPAKQDHSLLKLSQQQSVLFPLKIPVRGPLIVLPPLQQRIRLRNPLPPILVAQVTLKRPRTSGYQQQQVQQREQPQVEVESCCYRSNKQLLRLRKIHPNPQVGEARLTQVMSQHLMQHHEGQNVCFKVENITSKWLRVNWLLFDLGLWEMQTKLQEQLENTYELREAGLEAIRQRAISAAQEAASAAAEAAAAAAAATAVASAPATTARKPMRHTATRSPDPTVVAADAASAAAAAADEAAMKATEAAAAAADVGMVEAAGGWEALAAVTSPPPVALCTEQQDDQQQGQQYGPSSAVVESTRTMEKQATTMRTISSTPLVAEVMNRSIPGSSWSAKAASSLLDIKPKAISPVTKAAWADADGHVLPPSYCLISAESPISPEARGLAAAAEVMLLYRSSVPTEPVPNRAEPQTAAESSVEVMTVASAGAVDTIAQTSITRACQAAAPTCGVSQYNSCADSEQPRRIGAEGTTACDFTKAIPAETKMEEGRLLHPPSLEPNEMVLPPYGSTDVYLCPGSLQTAEGLHKLRALAIAVPLSTTPTTANLEAPSDAGPSATCTAAFGNSREATLLQSVMHRQPAQLFDVGEGASKETEPPVAPRTVNAPQCEQPIDCANNACPDTADSINAAASRTAAMPSWELASPQPVAATPLILDFWVETKRPHLQLGTTTETSQVGVEAAPRTAEGHLGTLCFMTSRKASESTEQGRSVAATPIYKEALLRLAPNCSPVTFFLSLEGECFKLHRAELQKQGLTQPSCEAQHQTLATNPKEPMARLTNPRAGACARHFD